MLESAPWIRSACCGTAAPPPPACSAQPGPDAAQLRAAARVRGARARPRQAGALALPRHRRRGPAARSASSSPPAASSAIPAAAPAVVEKDRLRFSHAPLVLAVIARLTPGHKVPEQEQLLSGGAVCFQLLQAADALGFGAQWLTGWAGLRRRRSPPRLGLAENERVLGFIHLGTAREPVPGARASRPGDAADASWRHERAPAGSLPGRREHVRVPRLAFAAGRVPATSTAGRSTPCTASPASCSSCSRSTARRACCSPSTPRSRATSATPSIRPTRPTASRAPEELKRQFAYCQQVCRALGFTVLADERYEADDLIGSALRRAAPRRPSRPDRVRRQGPGAAARRRRRAMGLRPQRALERARREGALRRARAPGRRLPRADRRRDRQHPRRARHRRQDRGDAARAFRLARRAARARSPKCPTCACAAAPRTPARLQAHREIALLSRRLATIACDAPLPDDFGSGERRPVDAAALEALCERLRFGPMTRRRLQTACGLAEVGLSATRRRPPRPSGEGKWLRMMQRGRWEYVERTNAGGMAVIVDRGDAGAESCCSSSRRACRSRARPSRCRPAWSATSTPANRCCWRPSANCWRKPAGSAGKLEYLMTGPSSAGMSTELRRLRARQRTRARARRRRRRQRGHHRARSADRRTRRAGSRERMAEGYAMDAKLWAGLWLLERNPDGSPAAWSG